MPSGPNSFIAPIFVLVASLFIAPFQAAAQQGASDNVVSAPIIESRIKEVQASTTLDTEVRDRLMGDYRKALGFIGTARTYAEKTDSFIKAGESAPDETRTIREQLEQEDANPADVILNMAVDASARDMETRLQTEKANHAALSAKLSSLEQQLAVQSNRPRVARERLVEASKLLDQLAADIKDSAAPADEPILVTEARRWVLILRAAATNSEIRMLDQELLSQATRVELLQVQRDQATRSNKQIDKRILLLEEQLSNQRRSETEQVIADSDTAVFGELAGHPLIRATAVENVELRQYLQTLTDQLELAEAATRAATSDLARWKKGFQTAQQRLEIAGLSQVLGQVLHEQRRDLPDLSEHRRRSSEREEAMAQVGLRDIQLEAERRKLRDIPTYVTELLADLPVAERDELAGPLQEMLTGRRVLIKNGIIANNNYLQTLGELDFQENQLIATASEFNDFLVQRLLWVRNKPAISLNTLLVLPAEVINFIDPRPWLDAIQILLARLAGTPLAWLVMLLIGGLLWKAGALRKALRATAKSVGRPAKDNIASTMRALGITLLLALPWPLLSSAVGWELSRSLDASDGANAIGIALLNMSRFLFFLSLFRAICMDGGLAEAHFKWAPSATRGLRKQLNLLMLTFLLPAFVTITAIEIRPDTFGGELSRILFMVATAGLLLFVFRVLKPGTGFLDRLLHAQGLTGNISWLWLVLGVTIPTVYAIAALAGYLYSAITLMSLLINSLWLLLFLVIAHQLASRWLLVVSGQLHLKVALERRAAEQALREKQKEGAADGETAPVVFEEDEIDVASIDVNTNKLLRLILVVVAFFGMAAIWSRVLPALTVLREFTLWEYLDGPVGQQQSVPVTLADFLLAIAYIFVAYVATRTVPSLIEAVLRQRDSSSGTRLAIVTLVRYSIVLVGVSMVASAIGFNWGKIQWLVAALGVGIGFGLQEIIANFISGLIILAERPIRVGDLVTVGDASGTVTRLQIRATTITNFDRQELLVPNKEFITGRVLNWSLSDEVIRLVVEVGVAYGTDMTKALALVRDALAEHKSVLKDPPPLVTFDAFGDNSLNIVARSFIGSLSGRREIASDIRLLINQKFNEAGIVVAFPQRDVHLDTSAPLDIRIQSGGGSEESAPTKSDQ